MAKKVLIVEDDRDCKEIMRYILENEGYEVLCSRSAEIIFEAPNIFDLVVLDEYSLGKTGSEVCRKLKSDYHTWDVPVILTSTDNELEYLAQSCHADTYLSKPFDITFFTTLVHKAVNHNPLSCY